MQIIHLNDDTFNAGKATFSAYLAGAVCGPHSDYFATSKRRQTGPQVLIGAIMACIAEGWAAEHEIVDAVTRATRCHATTVEMALDAFAGNDPAIHLWQYTGSAYSLHETRTRRPVLLAA